MIDPSSKEGKARRCNGVHEKDCEEGEECPTTLTSLVTTHLYTLDRLAVQCPLEDVRQHCLILGKLIKVSGLDAGNKLVPMLCNESITNQKGLYISGVWRLKVINILARAI